MSDSMDNPLIEHLRERARELQQVRDDATARLEEINGLLATFADGRTRVRRRLAAVDAQQARLPTPEPPEAD